MPCHCLTHARVWLLHADTITLASGDAVSNLGLRRGAHEEGDDSSDDSGDGDGKVSPFRVSVAVSRGPDPFSLDPANDLNLTLARFSHVPAQVAPKWKSIKTPTLDVKIDREDRSHLPDLLRELKALAQQLRDHLRIDHNTVRASLRQPH